MPLLADSTYRTSASDSRAVQRRDGLLPHPGRRSDSASTQSAILSYTIPGGGAGRPPSVLAVGEMSDSTLLVFFSEPVEETSAETPGELHGRRAGRRGRRARPGRHRAGAGHRPQHRRGHAHADGQRRGRPRRQRRRRRDLRASTTSTSSIPAGYYDSAIGLTGSALRVALHNLIKNHTVRSYDYALTAFQTTDVKPNGKVWDMYSDIPGGTPPYEYGFGADRPGRRPRASATTASTRGRSRGSTAPRRCTPTCGSSIPTDSYVNDMRANYPYGEVGAADPRPRSTAASSGRASSAGLRGHRVRADRRLQGRPRARPVLHVDALLRRGRRAGRAARLDRRRRAAAVGGDPVPAPGRDADPVSWKERMRNGAVYVIQGNRNPFVDHPEFVAMIYDSTSVVGVGDGAVAAGWTLRLRQNVPNPFQSRTTIALRPGAPRAGVARRLRRRGPPGPHADRRRGRARSGRPCRRVERPRRQRPAGRRRALLRAAPGPGRHDRQRGRDAADGGHAVASGASHPGRYGRSRPGGGGLFVSFVC